MYQNTVTLLIPAGKTCPAQGHSNIIPSCFPISKLRSHNLLIYMVNLIISQTNHNKYYQLQVTSINTVLHVLNTKCYYMAPPSGETNCFETIGRHIHSDPDTVCVRNVDIILPLYIKLVSVRSFLLIFLHCTFSFCLTLQGTKIVSGY